MLIKKDIYKKSNDKIVDWSLIYVVIFFYRIFIINF